jgi:hypothetical protein
MEVFAPVVLDNRLGAAEKSARQITVAPDEAAGCLEVQSLIEEVVGIGRVIQQDIERLHSASVASAESGRVWFRIYQRLDDCISSVSQLVVRLEQHGFRVSGRQSLAEMARHVKSITSLDFDRVTGAMENIGSNGARSLDEVMRELRDRP